MDKNYIAIAMRMQANVNENIYYNIDKDMKTIEQINDMFVKYNEKMSYQYTLSEFLDEEVNSFKYHDIGWCEKIWIRC